MYDKKTFLEWTAPHSIKFYEDKMEALIKQMSDLNKRVILSAVEWQESKKIYLGIVEYLPKNKEIVTTVEECQKDDILMPS